MMMVRTGVFSPVIHLRTLNLRYNRLADIGPQVFRSLPHLHDLDLQVRTPVVQVEDRRRATDLHSAICAAT